MPERTDHFAIAEGLLRPNRVWDGAKHVEMHATHADQRMASIHSNLARIDAMQTSSLIAYTKLLPVAPEYLLLEIAKRLGIEGEEA